MSSYNNIVKIKYSEKQAEADVVKLEEYIIFEDERARQKFIVFKFVNNINQQLQGLEFEVNQYNLDNELVEKSIAIYDNFLAQPNEPFVPNAKLKVNYACQTISIKIIKAAYDRMIFDKGEFLDNSYHFDHYFGDAFDMGKKKAPSAATAPSGKGGGKKGKGGKKKRKTGDIAVKGSAPKRGVVLADLPKMGKKSFAIENETTRNRAKFPTIFNIIAIVASLAFVGGTFWYMWSNNNRTTPEDDGETTAQCATIIQPTDGSADYTLDI